MTESMRSWRDVVSTDHVWSTKRNAWYEVLEIWPLADGTIHWKPRGVSVKAPFKVPADAQVKVRRSDMGAAVDTVNAIMFSGPNGYRDAGTDQMDPFIQRIRGVKRQMDSERDLKGLPPVGWAVAKERVLTELHAEAEERNA